MTFVKTNLSKQIITFFITTYLISWLLFFLSSVLDFMPLAMLGVWTPSLTSLFLSRYIGGKNGFQRVFKKLKSFKFKGYWWFVILLLPASIHLTGKSVWQWFYEGEVSLNILPISYWLGAILPSFLIAGFGEELGWRGYALPRLQEKFSPLTAAFILSMVHLCWHLPTYWLGFGTHNVPFVFMIAFIIPWTIILHWMYNKTNGNLLIAINFHAISNASLSIVSFLPPERDIAITPKLLNTSWISTEHAGVYLSVCVLYSLVALFVVFKGNFNKIQTTI